MPIKTVLRLLDPGCLRGTLHHCYEAWEESQKKLDLDGLKQQLADVQTLNLKQHDQIMKFVAGTQAPALSNNEWWQQAYIPEYVKAGLINLRHAIKCLRGTAIYHDEEGEATDSMEILCEFLEPLFHNTAPDNEKAHQAAVPSVPDGFVLVPIDQLIDAIHEIRSLNSGEYFKSEIEESICTIEAMVEKAQEKVDG